MNTAELEDYKRRLLEMRERLTKEVDLESELLRETIRKPGEIIAVPTHIADQDAEGLDAELNILGTETNVLEAVDVALNRIKDGSYGRCQGCKREITRERLDLLPYTPYCAVCARRHELRRSAR